jgi:hypothetical protein
MPDKKSIVVAFFLMMQTIQAQQADSVKMLEGIGFTI